jgi:hypothetical protein
LFFPDPRGFLRPDYSIAGTLAPEQGLRRCTGRLGPSHAIGPKSGQNQAVATEDQQRLPGIGRGRRRVGRHRRALDAYLRAVRTGGEEPSPEWQHMATIVRGLADDVDVAEHDGETSAWVIANTLSQYRAGALDLYRLAPVTLTRDRLGDLDDELDAILSAT